MTANVCRTYAVGAGICKVGLVLTGLGFFVQILSNFFYRQPFDRLFGLGLAFILTFALFWTLRAMELKAARSADSRIRYNDPRQAACLAGSSTQLVEVVAVRSQRHRP